MAKTSLRFVCRSCESVFPRWLGRCTTCGGWSTLEEERAPRIDKALASGAAVSVADVRADDTQRIPVGIGELDRVLGGGLVPGAVVLVGGDPGVGKSTLLLQALSQVAQRGRKVLYVSGEESAAQTADRARRLGAAHGSVFLLSETAWEMVEATVREMKPDVLVVDSIQTLRAPHVDAAPGAVSQLREVTSRLIECVKTLSIPTFLVGHVTKEGALAGPKVLEHLVDVVLSFEGERGHPFRQLRASKNRFGSATEVGTFEMTATGMREVENPSQLFLAERPSGIAGSVVAATAEGSRPMLVEVQALASPFAAGTSARRIATGADLARLHMVLAVLERHAGLALSTSDVFVNVPGGLRIEEPALDLPLALAIASGFRKKPVRSDLVAFGEIGLTGEIRSVPRAEGRISEVLKMGFARVMGPARGEGPSGFVGVKTLDQALAFAVEAG